MMSVRAIRITKHGQDPVCTELMLDAIGLPLNEPTCVHLLSQTDYDRLLEEIPQERLINRGIQDESKTLSYYFSTRTGNLAIRAKYSDPGQLLRGIRVLFNNRQTPATGARYFLGIQPALFENALLRSKPSDAKANGNKVPAPHSSALSELLAHHPDLIIPESLREVYRGTGPAVEAVRSLIMIAARNSHPVLIQGESGTGKEVVARQIHEHSIGAAGSFIAVNCGGIPDYLLESELFGHVKGAFTGATRNKDGLWKLAHNGTLFLDEIGDLELHHQAKLLRVLEDGSFRPVGGDKEITSNARIIAASNCDLQQLVSQGRFREDLFYRLFTLRIRTPALREHPQDIPDLAQYFWRKLCAQNLMVPTQAVLKELKHHPWRGNARELRAFILNVAAVADSKRVNTSIIQAVMKERYGGTVP